MRFNTSKNNFGVQLPTSLSTFEFSTMLANRGHCTVFKRSTAHKRSELTARESY